VGFLFSRSLFIPEPLYEAMNSYSRDQYVPTRFGRKTRFELRPRFEPIRGDLTRSAFEHLKTQLLKPALNAAHDLTLRRQLQLAANEAAAVAWTTPFPLLVLPELWQEKAAEVHRYTMRQEQVQEASQLLTERLG
jgi:hypothetical protein